MTDTDRRLIAKIAELEKWRERQETLEARRTWLFSQTADVTVANTTAETTLVGSGVGSLSLPANFFVPGRVVRVFAGGYFGYTGTPTIVLRNYYGSTNLGGTGIMTLAAGPTGTITWCYTNHFVCRTGGVSGTAACSVRADWVRDASNGLAQVVVGSGTASFDFTTSLTVDFRVAWGTASPSNTITCRVLVVEALN